MPKSQPNIALEDVEGRTLRVATWRLDEPSDNLPLLFFNGIGANIEAVAPFANAMPERPFIMFDMPGVGGSPDPVLPYTPFGMAHAAEAILDTFNVPVVDVMGVSWGGAMAQHFTLQHGKRVNRLVLAATTPGMFMVPGNIKALSKMADPRRYVDPDYMKKHFATLYGGSLEGSDGHIARVTPPSKIGYLYQLVAMLGWTSAPFLPFMHKKTLILMGSDDQIVVPFNGKILDFLIPDSTLKIIEGGGHLFMLSHLEETLAAVRAHLGAEEVRAAA